MDTKLKILHLEDSSFDAELVERELTKGNILFDKLVVDNRKDFEDGLRMHQPDIILSDHSLPSFDSLSALHIVKSLNILAPFILITATVSEEFAVDIMKQGAYDYILKDRLQRLPQAVLNAVERNRTESERKKYLEQVVYSEALMRETESLAGLGSFDIDLKTNSVKWSDELCLLLGYELGETTPSIEKIFERIHPDDVKRIRNVVENAVAFLTSVSIGFRLRMEDGKVKYIDSKMLVQRDSEKKAVRIRGFNQDITEKKNEELMRENITTDVLQRNKDLEQFSYIVSHNLRAPVANIIGLSDALSVDNIDPELKTEVVAGLSASAKKLDEVIVDLNTILDVRREIGEKKETISFTGLVDSIKTDLQNAIKKENVRIECDFSDGDKMLTRKSYLRSIFYNLISNSIRYRRPDVPLFIEISSRRYPNKLELLFKDNGMGIDLQKAGDQVFGLYKRFHSGRTEGKGMGLYLVKTQVDILGARIHINSKVNQGTAFIIEFPN